MSAAVVQQAARLYNKLGTFLIPRKIDDRAGVQVVLRCADCMFKMKVCAKANIPGEIVTDVKRKQTQTTPKWDCKSLLEEVKLQKAGRDMAQVPTYKGWARSRLRLANATRCVSHGDRSSYA
jgi:hypothetical protein